MYKCTIYSCAEYNSPEIDFSNTPKSTIINNSFSRVFYTDRGINIKRSFEVPKKCFFPIIILYYNLYLK